MLKDQINELQMSRDRQWLCSRVTTKGILAEEDPFQSSLLPTVVTCLLLALYCYIGNIERITPRG